MTGPMPPASVSGDLDDIDDIAVLHPCGEFDLANHHQLGTEIHHAVISGHRLVVVDFGEVTFIDASVIRMLLRHQRLAESRGCRLNLVNVKGVAELILRALHIGPPLWADAE